MLRDLQFILNIFQFKDIGFFDDNFFINYYYLVAEVNK